MPDSRTEAMKRADDLRNPERRTPLNPYAPDPAQATHAGPYGPDPSPQPQPPARPLLRRISYEDHAGKAVEHEPDRIKAGIIKGAAVRLQPLQQVQVVLDQLVNQVNDYFRNPAASNLVHNFRGHVQAELEGVRRHAAALDCAARAARTMLDDIERQLKEAQAMPDDPKKPEDRPQLTDVMGDPHPLVEGEYDPAQDPGLPPNISDIEALKEGKTTRKQAEALAQHDTEGSDATPAGTGTPNEQEAEAQAPKVREAGGAAAPSPGPATAPPKLSLTPQQQAQMPKPEPPKGEPRPKR